MRLPASISILDDTHCSLNCQLMNLGCCTARGYNPDSREMLRKKDGPHYLRTGYCQKEACTTSEEELATRLTSSSSAVEPASSGD